MPKLDDKAHFDVHPSVVFQLGESLISDAIQALIELVKNCYDADATYAKVTIDTSGSFNGRDCRFGSEGGRIIVEDDGHGMSEQDIINGWLLISNRAKRSLKEAMRTTPGGRTPLGDKGLGRLGVQRLGDGLDVFTKINRGPSLHFSFSWMDFATAPSLRDVDVHLQPSHLNRKHGTTVVVSNLLEPDLWRGEEALKRLNQNLSQMISPFKAIRDFVVYVEVDGKPLDLIEISERVRNVAPIRYRIRFDGKVARFEGRARLDFFRPSNEGEAAEFALIAESDHGKQLYNFLNGLPEARRYSLKKSDSSKWYVEFKLERDLEDIDGLELEFREPYAIANPGPFTGEVDAFDLGTSAFRSQSVFDAITEYRNTVKALSGIRAYRDGFAIRVDRDWLKLGAGWTSARSYYGLKPDNTLGYVALSARENMVLEETTDREGFKDSPYYRNFYRVLQDFRRFADDVQRFFGRSWVEFRKVRVEQIARVDTRKSIEDLSRTIRVTVEGAANHHNSVEKVTSRMRAGVAKSITLLERMAQVDQVTPAMQRQAKETHEGLEVLINDSKEVMEGVTAYLEQLHDLRGIGQVLEGRAEGLRRQVDDMYEAVALGLSAEAIVHEVFQITETLANRTKRLSSKLNGSVDSKAVHAYLEHVRSATSALRKQVSFLSPSLRFVREKKEDIVIVDFLKELQSFYRDRLSKSGISLMLTETTSESFIVHMNRGKLTQIIDNFVLNSEYWLREEIRHGRLDAGEIAFEIDRPFIRVNDNGRGIDPSVESVLFEPFVTTKDRGIGRGLGLFIVKQLLDSDGCHVGILPKRNRSRRLHIFQIDFRGALHD